MRSHEGSSLLSFIAVAWSWKLLWRVTRAKLLKYSMYSSGKSEETTIGQRVSEKAYALCITVLYGYWIERLHVVNFGQDQGRRCLDAYCCRVTLYRLVSDCIFAVAECISSWAVVLPVNFEHVRSDIHNDFQAETDTLMPLSKLPTNLVKVRLDAGDRSINYQLPSEIWNFCFQAFESQATNWSFSNNREVGRQTCF